MTILTPYSVLDIATICEAVFLQTSSVAPAPVYLSLDSRRTNSPEKTFFLAVRTHFQNATKFIAPLYAKGCRNFMTDDPDFDATPFPEANILLVANVIGALQRLAAYHRLQYDLRVIAITGSNGKTIVKEWLNHLLGEELHIIRSPKSYNSQSGVPLSILQINRLHNIGLFEAGISQKGEMEKLEQMIKPEIGIFTNIGSAHERGFLDIREKIREKLRLFEHAQQLVYPTENKLLAEEIDLFLRAHPGVRPFTWGCEASNDLHVLEVRKEDRNTLIKVRHRHKKRQFTIPFTDDISIYNAICCAAALFVLDAPEHCFSLFESLFRIAMRLEMKPGINDCTIINDSYSNDLQSLSMALGFLDQQKQDKKRTVILSDIPQSLTPPEKLYKQVADLLQQYHVKKFIGIGPQLQRQKESFSAVAQTSFYTDATGFLRQALLHQFRQEIILVKGARAFEFEKISSVLEQKTHQTVLNVNLTHLVHNLKAYRSRLKPRTKVMAMVKAFGYGSGTHEIASVLEYHKVNYLAVAYVDEGVDLRKAGITLPIMVMNTDVGTWDSLTANKLEPEIFSYEQLLAFSAYARDNDLKDYPIHIKIDTGMHRLGFLPAQMQPAGEFLKDHPHLKVVSAFTHLSSADDPGADLFTRRQYEVFNDAASALAENVGYSFLRHIGNSAAAGRLPALQADMVRLGIGLYGIDADEGMQKELLSVLTLTTTISQIKHLDAGECVGYGRHYVLRRPSTIATVRIGYADGYPRSLGNGAGAMLVSGAYAPVAGNVCMDMCMIDITDIPNVREGDEVIVFGPNLPIQTVAKRAGLIPYEMMTGISQRVKRVYVEI